MDEKLQDVFRTARKQLAVPFSDEIGVAAALKEDKLGLGLVIVQFQTCPSMVFSFSPKEIFGIMPESKSLTKRKTTKSRLPYFLILLWVCQKGIFEGVLTHPSIEQGRLVDLSIDQVIYGKAEDGITVNQTKDVFKIESGFNQLALMLGLITIAMAIWLYGKAGYSSKYSNSRLIFRLVSLALLLFGIWIALSF